MASDLPLRSQPPISQGRLTRDADSQASICQCWGRGRPPLLRPASIDSDRSLQPVRDQRDARDETRCFGTCAEWTRSKDTDLGIRTRYSPLHFRCCSGGICAGASTTSPASVHSGIKEPRRPSPKLLNLSWRGQTDSPTCTRAAILFRRQCSHPGPQRRAGAGPRARSDRHRPSPSPFA